jgi:hypothetical protein
MSKATALTTDREARAQRVQNGTEATAPEQAALSWFATELQQIPDVRAAFATVRSGRTDVWTVLYDPEDDAEHALFERQRALRERYPDQTFDFALLYRPMSEALEAQEWTSAGWLTLLERVNP